MKIYPFKEITIKTGNDEIVIRTRDILSTIFLTLLFLMVFFLGQLQSFMTAQAIEKACPPVIHTEKNFTYGEFVYSQFINNSIP